MTLWTAREAADATGGQAASDWSATGVSIDTRTLQPGDLFVALKDIRDGHDFVADALDKGAAAAMVSQVPDGVATDKLLIVDNVLAALGRLGAAGRARTDARIVAVTGSVGKTSTKEMLRVALHRLGNIHAAEASYNNHWGVPLTLARMPADTDVAIIEIGMNAPGEIAPLSRLTRPHVALVTTVAAAHLAAFDDLAGIAREKASIFDGLESGGTAIYPDDIDTSAILADAAAAHAPASFGHAGYVLTNARMAGDATIIRAVLRGTDIAFKLSVPGVHFAKNGLAVLAVADALGADLAVTAQDLAAWRPPAGRGTRERRMLDTVDPRDAFDLIDDAFNANPTSMEAALQVLAATFPWDGVGLKDKGRRIAILGDMLELGPDEERLHKAITELPAMQAVDVVHCVGPLMRALYDTLPVEQRGQWVDTASELAGRAQTLVDAGDVVLVKGSKGSKVSTVVTALRRLSQPMRQDDA